MDTTEALSWLGQNFNAFDGIAVLITYFFTGAFKGIVEKDEYKRLVAIVMGQVVALGLASAFGGWGKVIFFGMVYAAGAMFLYLIGFQKILDKIGEVVKGKIR